ncbi:hypothetical protein GGR88_000512 [Sphingomonas jejuensis]|uniref:DUF7847 domain-containing protein n=1 Tax=Sphingomonas jejuensis TaxID=904715 RepID=A0ABX0XIP0_9SPHN|nr:hypothetical protein [Sphingomonas jejuensis]NJC33038.1 hypothetical protein [Sphingomonas jejuensis]
MQSLSIDRAWTETRQRVFANAALLWPIAFTLLALPGVIFQYLVLQPRLEAFAASGNTDFTVFEGSWYLWGLPVIALLIVGTVAVLLLTGRSGVSVGEALAVGLRRSVPLFIAMLLLGVVAGAAAGVIGGILTATMGAVGAAIGRLLLLILFAYGGVRIGFLSPAVAAYEGVGPIAILRRSWALSRGNFWRLFGILLVLVVVSFIVSVFVTIVFGIVVSLASGGQPGPVGTLLTLLVSGLLNAVISVFFTVMAGQIYRQLAGDPREAEKLSA